MVLVGAFVFSSNLFSVKSSLLLDKGKYSNEGAHDCTVCGAGEYAGVTGAPNCTRCPAGKVLEDDLQADASLHDDAEDW